MPCRRARLQALLAAGGQLPPQRPDGILPETAQHTLQARGHSREMWIGQVEKWHLVPTDDGHCALQLLQHAHSSRSCFGLGIVQLCDERVLQRLRRRQPLGGIQL